MQLITIIEDQQLDLSGWNYKKTEEWMMFYKIDNPNHPCCFEWLFISSEYEQHYTGKEGIAANPDDDYPIITCYYPSEIFLCGEYSYKLLCIDYHTMAMIGQYGASTTSSTYLNIFYELHLLHQKIFPYQHKDTRFQTTITYNNT